MMLILLAADAEPSVCMWEDLPCCFFFLGPVPTNMGCSRSSVLHRTGCKVERWGFVLQSVHCNASLGCGVQPRRHPTT